MADLLVPGLGSVAEVLFTALKLCAEMKEGQEACTRLHTCLSDILSEIGRMRDRNQIPPSDSLNKYVGTIANYHGYLLRYRDKPVFSRLIRHYSMMDEFQVIQQDVSMLFGMFHLAATASMMDWRQQWEADRRIQMERLKATVKNDAAVLRELQSVRDMTEALMTLTYELKEHAYSQADDMKHLMLRLRATVIRASNTESRELKPWFLPADEVVYEPKEFARGSFGTVHHGIWGSGASVVVKCLIIDHAQMDERAQKRIEEEVDIWYSLNHPNVIKMFGASHVSSPPFIVCEYATNGNLCSFLMRSGNMRKVWQLLYQAALGLEHMHKSGVVHGDLKLNNILVSGDGVAKLSDFSFSAVRTCASASKQCDNALKVTGALRWRAPECLHRRPSFSSDVYSLAMCIVEAFEGHPPFVHLDNDDAVRDALRHGEMPEQPKKLENAAWELVKAMAKTNPKNRMPLSRVLAKLKALAGAEKESQGVQQGDTEVEHRVETPAAPRLSLILCEVCRCSVFRDSKFCSQCGICFKTSKSASTAPESVRIDSASSVASLMDTITNGPLESKERSLSLLARKCIDKQERMALYSAKNIRVLSNVVRSGTTYFSQLHALGALSWTFHDSAVVSEFDLHTLRDNIRSPSEEELAAIVTLLKLGTADEIDDALVLCDCLGVISTWGLLDKFDNRIIGCLVLTLQNGSATQKIWATHALGSLAFDNSENRVLIGREGGISPLVTLVKIGTDEQRTMAARALGNLACYNDTNCTSIIRDGGVRSLEYLVMAGTEEQKRCATYALRNLSCCDPTVFEAMDRNNADADGDSNQDEGESEHRGNVMRSLIIPSLEFGNETSKRHPLNAVMNLINPVFGVVGDIFSVYTGMKEDEEECRRLYARLVDIVDEIEKMRKRNEMPPSVGLDKYTRVIVDHITYLQWYLRKRGFSRLIQHHIMARNLRVIQQDLSTLFVMLQLSAAPNTANSTDGSQPRSRAAESS